VTHLVLKLDNDNDATEDTDTDMKLLTSLAFLSLLAGEASARTPTTPAFLSLVFGPPQQEQQAPAPEEHKFSNPININIPTVDAERLNELKERILDMLKERQWESLPWPVKAAIGCAPFCITGVQSLLRRRVGSLKSAETPAFQPNTPEAEIAAAMAPLMEAEIDAAMRQAAAAAAGGPVPAPWTAPGGGWSSAAQAAESEEKAKSVFQASSPDDEVAAAVAAVPRAAWSPGTAAAEIAAALAPVVEAEIDIAMRAAAAAAAGADAPATPAWPASAAAL